MGNDKQVNLNITGMTCAACSSRIEKVLNKMDDVDASVNLTTEKATVEYDSENVDISDITGKIEKLGYGVEMEKVEFDITGMTCAACSNRIEKVLNKQEGVKSATVNLTTENAVIEYNPSMLTDRDLIARVEKLGYGADSNQKYQNATLRSRPDIPHYPFKPCATGQVASGGNPKIKIRSKHMKMCVLSVVHVF